MHQLFLLLQCAAHISLYLIGLLVLIASPVRSMSANGAPAYVAQFALPTATKPTSASIAFATDAPRFERLSLEEGLSSNLAQAVVQDRQGFIWIATLEGLNKYDGYDITAYRPQPGNQQSISDTVINGIYVDSSGNLWIGTTNGLNRFDPASETFTRFIHDPEDPQSVGDDAFSVAEGFYEDDSGRLWFSTWGGGLSRFDPATETFTRFQHDPADPAGLAGNGISRMVPSHDGTTLWLGTFTGLTAFDIERETARHYQHDPQDPQSLSSNEVNSVHAATLDGASVVWAGTGDGLLNQFDPATETFTHHRIGNTKITEIFADDNGILWLGTQGEGIFLFDPGSRQVVKRFHQQAGNPAGLSADLVNHIYEDRSGALWISTYTGGVSRLDPHQKGFQLYQYQPGNPNSLSSSNIFALDLDQQGGLWVGTLDTGVNRLDLAGGTVERFRHDPAQANGLSHNLIGDVLVDSRGRIWIATVGGGLNRLDSVDGQFQHYRREAGNSQSLLSDGVLVLMEDSAGMIWIGTADAGLSRLDLDRDEFTHFRPGPPGSGMLSDGSIGALFEDSRGRIWVGTKQGLDVLDPAGGPVQNYVHDDTDPHSISHNYVKSIYEDAAGDLWLATDVGLNRFDRDQEQFFAYFTTDGLPHDQVNSIVADDSGMLWIGTAGGLARFDPQNETFHRYNQHDGLQGDVFAPNAALRGPDGRLYFGGSQGLNVFQPAELRSNPYAPPVVLTEFALFNEPVPPGADAPLDQHVSMADVIVLRHDQSVLGFEFVALNYTAPANNQYAYMMADFDQDWNYTDSSRRSARYTNLDPGRYTFRVKAANNDGVWNEAGTAIGIIVTPPWWATFWLRGLALMVLLGAVLGGFQWRVWQIQQRQRWLEQEVERRTEELRSSEAELRRAKQSAETANQAKSIFLASMSHELRTPLSTILGYADILHDRYADQDARLGQDVQRIQRSSDHLLALIDEVLDISRIEAGSIALQPAPLHLAEFIQEIVASIRPKVEPKRLHLELDIAAQLPEYMHADAVRLRQVLLNLLANAVKYTDQGRITFSVAQPAPEQLQFVVADTGYGIAEADLETIFEPFQQVRSDQQPASGLGLGLSISRRLVRLMGSDIQVTSTPGAGSTFSFALPLKECAGTAAPELSYKIVGLQHQGPAILVIDDLADNRDVLVEQLAPLGFEMHTAATAQAALELVAGCRPAAIFVDLMLPDMDGAELIGHLRRLPHLQQTLIIVNSGSAFAEDRERSLAAGGDEFLPKPVRRRHLLEVLGRHLHLEWRYADSIEAADSPEAGQPSLPAEAIPDQAELQQLYHLAMMGHAAALKERAVELRRDAQLEPFAAELERLAGSLQLNRLSAWLAQYLER